jgi:hypothetical protein
MHLSLCVLMRLRLNMRGRAYFARDHSLIFINLHFIVLNPRVLLRLRVLWSSYNRWKFLNDLSLMHRPITLVNVTDVARACFDVCTLSFLFLLFIITSFLRLLAVVSATTATCSAYVFLLSIETVLVSDTTRSIKIYPLVDPRRDACDLRCFTPRRVRFWLLFRFLVVIDSDINRI